MALRVVKLHLRDVGLVSHRWHSDVMVGATVAVAFALVQFLIIIPNTGGASRSDVLGTSRVALISTIVATVLLFAAGHGYQGWAGVVDTGLYGGLTLTLLYVWRGRLTACIVAHALWNTLATVAISLWY